MPIRKMAICDVCHKAEDLYGALNERKYFMVNVAHVYCSEKCYEFKKDVERMYEDVEHKRLIEASQKDA